MHTATTTETARQESERLYELQDLRETEGVTRLQAEVDRLHDDVGVAGPRYYVRACALYPDLCDIPDVRRYMELAYGLCVCGTELIDGGAHGSVCPDCAEAADAADAMETAVALADAAADERVAAVSYLRAMAAKLGNASLRRAADDLEAGAHLCMRSAS